MSILKAAITSGDHVLGAADAPATVVEYGDYQCPKLDRQLARATLEVAAWIAADSSANS